MLLSSFSSLALSLSGGGVVPIAGVSCFVFPKMVVLLESQIWIRMMMMMKKCSMSPGWPRLQCLQVGCSPSQGDHDGPAWDLFPGGPGLDGALHGGGHSQWSVLGAQSRSELSNSHWMGVEAQVSRCKAWLPSLSPCLPLSISMACLSGQALSMNL